MEKTIYNTVYTILLVILFLIMLLFIVSLTGVKQVGVIHIGESRSEMQSRCLEKGYTDYKVSNNKITCINKQETLVLE